MVLGTDYVQLPHEYVEQLRAGHGWAAADHRLGADFLRAVLHETPSRLVGLR